MQDALKRPSVTSEARRRQILDAAVATIAADGLAKASFSAIAERAGLSSVGLISYHFAGRDELIGQIVADYYASITAHMQDRMAGISSPTAALEAYISGVIDYIGAHPAQMKALTEVFLQGAMNHGRVEEDAATGPLEDILRAGQRAGEFRPFDAPIMAALIQRAVDGLPFLLASRPELEPRSFAQNYATEVVAAFRLATRSEPPP